MPELLLFAALCCAVMTAALMWMLRPPRASEAIIRACAAAAGAASVSVTIGVATDADTAAFFLASAFAWALVLTWSLVVFPVCAVVPPLIFGMCAESECRVEDFGGGLALLVSSAASVLLAWRAPGGVARESWARFALPVLLVWVAGALWLASLEGVIDAYTWRILLAALAAPLAGAVAWTLVDVLRRSDRHPLRSAADGLLAGLVAIVPGARLRTATTGHRGACGALGSRGAHVDRGRVPRTRGRRRFDRFRVLRAYRSPSATPPGLPRCRRAGCARERTQLGRRSARPLVAASGRRCSVRVSVTASSCAAGF